MLMNIELVLENRHDAVGIHFTSNGRRKRRDHFNFFKKCGIPGPPPSIIFGNILEMYRKSPTKAYREWIEKYGDVVGYFNGYRPVVLVADLDLLRNIQVKDFQDFTDRALLFQAKRPPSPQNKGLLQLTSTRWKEVRSVLTPSFTTSKLKMMSPGIISAVEKLVSKVGRKAATGEEFEAGEMYAALALDVICKSAMGIDYNLQDQPRHGFLIFCRMLFGCAFSFIAVILSAFPSWESGLRFINSRWLRYQNGGVHPFIDVQEKCKRIVTQRQQDSSLRQKDLLQLMIDAKDAQVDLDTVTSAQLTAAEDNDRELQDKAAGGGARRDLSVFNKAVLDDDDITQNAFVVLVGGIVTREAVVDKQYGKFRIPAGTAIMAAAEYIHRDPRHWDNPDQFDPERFLPENKSKINTMAMQAFGNGPRNCIGMRFAHMELRYTFAHILQKYRLEKTENSEKDPPNIDMNPLVLKIKKGVIVRAVPLKDHGTSTK
ncbi:hypothetical protein HPB52_013185 [Rhipicephalus sanguineus]|uniref:Thromboxane-A synthase n=1 Tax=Rhipicephalus sanguineus TaxID=34632 RepID=A0A9D4PMC8_RHISA|nr:hypothetical protein HPB52_013185 [Rhipicephalus sanguineus]